MKFYINTSLLILFSIYLFACKSTIETTKKINICELPLSRDTLKYTSGIRCIFQDSKGNYWIGSHQEGVCRVDAVSNTYFSIENGLSGNQVKAIHEDEFGTLWFDTDKGVSRYDRQGMVSLSASKNSLDNDFLMVPQWELSSSDLWFSNNGTFEIARVDKNKIHYLSLPLSLFSTNEGFFGATAFSKGKSGALWIAEYSTALRFDGKSFMKIDKNHSQLTDIQGYLHIRSILEDSKGNVWLGNNGIGVLLLSNERIQNFSEEKNLIHPNSSRNGSHSPKGTLEHVFAIYEDSSGNIWFGDRDTGAWKYEGANIENIPIRTKQSNLHVWNIYEDSHKNLLICMASGGIYCLKGKEFVRVL